MAIERVGVLKHLRLCVVVGGGLASFQAVLWVALTMVGIIMYGDCDIAEPNLDNYLGIVMRIMYFMDNNVETCSTNVKLTKASYDDINLTDSEQILVWESVYMAMSVFWLVSSVLLIIYVTWEKISSALLYMYMWSCSTLVISIVDLVLGALLGKDMDNISKYYSKLGAADMSSATEYAFQMMKISSGILMTVAMRGFILWIINVACAVYIFMCIVEINRELLKGDDYQHSAIGGAPIRAYDNPSAEARSSQWTNGTGNIERPHLKSASYGRSNSQYGESNLGYSNSNFPSSSAVNNSSFGNNNNYNNSSFGNNNNNNPSFANSNSPKFGNNNNNNNFNNNNQSRQPSGVQAKPMPWERAREPITPSPDYDSPPPQRTARSAMKQNAPPPPSSSLYRR